MSSSAPTDRSNGGPTAHGPDEPLAALASVFEAAPYGVVVARGDWTIAFASSAVHATFAYSPGQLIGQPVSRLLPAVATHGEPWQEVATRAPGGRTGVDRIVDGLRQDGSTTPLQIGLSVLNLGPSQYVMVSIVDLTERRELDTRLAAEANEHVAFHRLVAEIAARFGGVAPSALDEAIGDSLRQIAEALQLSRAIFWRRRKGEADATATHFWASEPHPAPDPHPLATSIRAGQLTAFTGCEDAPEPIDHGIFGVPQVRSGAVIPLAVGEDEELSVLAFGSINREIVWAPEIVERLRLVAGVVSQAIARTRSQLALQEALDEVRLLRDRVSAENVELRREVRVSRGPGVRVADSPSMKSVLAQVEQVAPTPATVLLLGETGSGKDMVALAIHNLSPRHQRQMVRVSCAAIPGTLIESELFGRERGAYTGALSRQLGRFEAANQSTLFLDEIGDLPMDIQVKLLRVLQDRVIERLGSTHSIKVDLRIIAATNRNLEDAVNARTFREDLFYRLNVFPIVVPPLRDRVEDIPGLVWSFVDEFSKSFRKTIESVPKESMRELQRYSWPGNVRELRNIIERAVIVSTGPELVVPAPRSITPVPPTAMTLMALEIEHIRGVLESTNWRVRGHGGAAERLGLKPTTLESRMARLGIARKRVP